LTSIITESDEKLAKTKVIDGMLQELDMSKQELIELIKALTEQSISEEKSENIEASLADDKIIKEKINPQQIAQFVASGNTEAIAQYLNMQQLSNLSIRIGFAYSLKRAAELGIVLDTEKLASQMGIPAFSRFLFNGKMLVGGSEKALSKEQAAKATAEINNNISQFLSATEQYKVKTNAAASNKSDSNSVTNPNSVQNLVSKIASIIRVQVQMLGGSVAQMLNSGSAQVLNRTKDDSLPLQNIETLSASMQQNQGDNTQQQSNPAEAQKANEEVKPAKSDKKKSKSKTSKSEKETKSDKKLKSIYYKELRPSRRREVYATIRSQDGIMLEINLNKMLADNNRLTPQNQAILDKILEQGIKFESGVSELLSLFPNAKNIQVDKDNNLVIQIESKEDLKALKLTDVLAESKKKDDRKQQRRENRREERRAVRKVNAEAEKVKNQYSDQTTSDIERSKEQSRGPDLDKKTPINDLEAKNTQLFINENQKTLDEITGDRKDTKSKEIKRTADELIKLDALHDKMKMLETAKMSNELSQIKNSVGEVMKTMPEAEKNKDLLAEMKKEMQKGKFLDK
jgi:hypothetical protein